MRSSSPDLLRLADAAFAPWPRTRAKPELRLRFDVRQHEADLDAPLRYRLPARDRLIITGDGVLVHVDGARGRARGVLASSRLRHADDLRYGVIEAAALFLLTQRDRVPFHAAALVRGSTAVLLAGPSGAGKSTSAWAAVRAGWTLLSDDCVYLQTGGRPRVWGWPGYVHVGSDAGRFFHELSGHDATVQANGKLKIALRATALPRPWTDRATLCLLERTPAGPRIDPLARTDALRAVTARLEPGFDLFAAALPAALERVIGPAAWRLDPGPDPESVPRLLDRLAR